MGPFLTAVLGDDFLVRLDDDNSAADPLTKFLERRLFAIADVNKSVSKRQADVFATGEERIIESVFEKLRLFLEDPDVAMRLRSDQLLFTKSEE